MAAHPPSVAPRAVSTLFAAGVLLNCAFGQAIKAKPARAEPRILFVCEHGAAKSVIAASTFDKLAKEQRLPHRALFRGVHPDATLNPVAKDGLERDGVDTSGWKPTLVTQKDVDEASRVVTLGCMLPGGLHARRQVTDWNDIPSPSENYSRARDHIKEKVRNLVAELQTRNEHQRKRENDKLKGSHK
jgi:arsenate reductase (thioredoxin)